MNQSTTWGFLTGSADQWSQAPGRGVSWFPSTCCMSIEPLPGSSLRPLLFTVLDRDRYTGPQDPGPWPQRQSLWDCISGYREGGSCIVKGEGVNSTWIWINLKRWSSQFSKTHSSYLLLALSLLLLRRLFSGCGWAGGPLPGCGWAGGRSPAVGRGLLIAVVSLAVEYIP